MKSPTRTLPWRSGSKTTPIGLGKLTWTNMLGPGSDFLITKSSLVRSPTGPTSKRKRSQVASKPPSDPASTSWRKYPDGVYQTGFSCSETLESFWISALDDDLHLNLSRRLFGSEVVL
eukprot:CAMPEP_0197863576 /NCGR_PEP_ID=MMETSP1438-20131217/41115_1 /TAXON_ID=1461541 /ORGANISM="Pterosperma sp., Strain CCMP1384" /LENGTH=117 /DNA_ID=CAMNT_0043481531 /DNA_START=454 /DNA_END=807 /DNA_ORIENTATION=-